MLHLDSVDASTLELLRKLQSLDTFKDTRLVGGTALALQLGHRRSVDLDFFGSCNASLEELSAEISTFAAMKLSAITKSLTYFEDAEDDPMPEMSLPTDWTMAKESIVSDVHNYLSKRG